MNFIELFFALASGEALPTEIDPTLLSGEGLGAEIARAVANQNNAEVATALRQSLSGDRGTSTQRQQVLDELQIDSSSYNSDIEEAIGNFSQGGQTGRLNEMPDYNASSIITLLGDNQDIVNILLINYLINIVEGGDSTSFTDYLTTNEGQEQVEIALNSILLEETSFYGLIGTSANTGTTTAADIVSRLNEAAGDTTVPDDPSGTEGKVEDISDAVAKQCVLLQLLQPLSDFYDKSLKEIIRGDIPYSGRILKLNCNEPSNFINYVSGVPRLAESFTEIRKSRSDEVTEVLTPLNEFRLSFIKDNLTFSDFKFNMLFLVCSILAVNFSASFKGFINLFANLKVSSSS